MTDQHKTARDKDTQNINICVLHLAFTMKARGTETWLMNLLRRIDRQKIQMDFVTTEGETGFYDDEIRSLGGKLYPLPPPNDRKSFSKALRALLKAKKYDVVHAHPYTFSGLIMREARRAGVPVRITHSHTDRQIADKKEPLWKRLYYTFMKRAIYKHSTHRIAVSPEAATSLFEKKWHNDPAYKLIHCGIDLTPFKDQESTIMREALGIPDNAKIIGHVGGLYAEKNHEFIINTFSKVRDNHYLLLVGSGPLQEKLESLASSLGILDRVIFTGARNDVPHLLKIMDVFIFPSIFEGLGLSLVEAQAAGIYCIISENIPHDAIINPDLVYRMSLIDDQILWARKIEDLLKKPPYSKADALSLAQSSTFNIENNIKEITKLYYGALKQEER